MADISRSEVASLIAEEYGPETIKSAIEGSTALAAFPTVNMGTKTRNLPVLATLPEAAWVGESATEASGVKPTSKATWANKTLVAEEVAVIVPVHENVLDDATEDVLANLAKLGGQALGLKLDQAVLFGIDKPTSWTSPALLSAAVTAGNAFTVTPGAANGSDLFGVIAQAAGAVAEDGFSPDTLLSSLALRWRMANLRDANGNLAFRDESFAGFSTFFNRNGAWASTSAEALVVDSSRVRIGVRQDVTVKFLDQATLGTGEDQINLAERDMVALRFVARFAYVLASGATSVGPNKFPVGAALPAA